MKIAPILFSLLLGGCALFKENSGPPPSFGPREMIYYASYDEVWRATQLALQNYPMRINNSDLGILETDTIRGLNVWTPAHINEKPTGGLSYKLVAKVIRGNLASKPAQKVSIVKEIRLQNDFFAEERPQPSDGLEEKSLLYRIDREIKIDRALQKAAKKSTGS